MKLLIVYVFPFAMMMAAFLDLLTMKLPNRFVIAFAAAFFPAALAVSLPWEVIGSHAVAGGAMLAVTFSMFIAGWIGGGDAKFFAASALWLGWEHLLEYSLLSAFLGGILTVGLLFARTYPLPMFLARQEWVLRLHAPRTGIPYGVAMAMAGILMFSQTQWGTALGL
ncbi:prepilin peptidase [Tepidamorphus sp. 3E244]|uniref:A24 family peptidase n=1 Tax=Tepidamorphus sp. 3E244 TaxID=3385498 RepID=UPI0038FCDB33